MSAVLLSLTLLAFAAIESALARTPKPGEVELSVSGAHLGSSLSSDGEDLISGSTTQIDASVGYFVSPVLEVGGGLGFVRQSQKEEGSSGEAYHSLSVGADVLLNMPTQSSLLPYVDLGASVVVYGGDGYGDETSFVFPSIIGGLRSFVSESASVNISFGYARQNNIGGWEDLTADHVIAGLGISLFLGGD